jgi:hypothetical protein
MDENLVIKELKEKKLDPDLLDLLIKRDSGAKFLDLLPQKYPPKTVATPTQEQRVWELIGLYYREAGRFNEALLITSALYNQMILYQQESGNRVHKGMPLVWMSDFYLSMGYPTHSKRFLMMTLCEDSIREKGVVSPEISGVYFRLVWRHGLSDTEFKRYAKEIYKLSSKNPIDSMFPEWILQKIDKAWITEIPSTAESGFYTINKLYINSLLAQLGSKTGQELEILADYLLSCLPGCRTTLRQRSKSTDYDIVCSMEGFDVDFRSEFGRYFVCECKDWHKPADFSTMAKFCRVLDSTKSRFGILFSKKGITGEGRTSDAAREQLKVFQDRGMIIVVVSKKDLEFVSKGGNFINLLRAKYEKVRLDLITEKTV